jgi:hypothetical protein
MLDKSASHPLALLALVASNLIPVVGVVFFGWDLLAILLLYWAENGVIGVFNLLKMLTAAQDGFLASLPAKLFVMPFFTFHYGMFWSIHGVFVMTLFGNDSLLQADCTRQGSSFSCQMPSTNTTTTGDAPMGDASMGGGLWDFLALDEVVVQGWLEAGVGVALLGLIISHGVSFVSNYLWQGEFLRTNARALMRQPYSRVIILHVTIVLGSFLVMALGQPIMALLLLVTLKTGVDIAAHLREHTTNARHTAVNTSSNTAT